jgi:tetratricopeptide (TPR) repeat protein
MLGERWLKTAYSYLYIRDFPKAADSFARAIHCDPTNPLYYFHGSMTALRNDNLAQALDWAEKAVELDPHNHLYEEHLGVVKSRLLMVEAQVAIAQSRMDRAKQLLEEALAVDPLNADALMELSALTDVANDSEDRDTDYKQHEISTD